jgi:hypothetical protein
VLLQSETLLNNERKSSIVLTQYARRPDPPKS